MKVTSTTFEILDNLDFEYNILEDYSGRGMFGETTDAIETPASKEQILGWLEDAVINESYVIKNGKLKVNEFLEDDEDELDLDTEYAEDIFEVYKAIKAAKVDSLGKHNIVIY